MPVAILCVVELGHLLSLDDSVVAQSDGAALAGALGGEAQHGDLRVDAEQLCGLGGLNGHLSQLGSSGHLDFAGGLVDGVGVVDVDGAVAHGNALQALFAAVAVQDEAGAHP